MVVIQDRLSSEDAFVVSWDLERSSCIVAGT